MKMSNFIIGIVVSSLILTVFLTTFDSMRQDYGFELNDLEQDNYDNWSVVFDQTTAIQSEMDTVQNETFNINPTGLTDILGGFVSASVGALKTAWQSFGIFSTMTFKMAEILHIPQVIVNALITVLVILIVIGVIVSTMVKKDV